MAAPEGLAIPVSELLGSKLSSTSLGERIEKADANHDGVLSVAELLEVFRQEHRAQKNAKWWAKVALGLFALLVVLLAANAGLTYAVVALSKDTSVTNNTLVVAGNASQPVMTSALEFTVDPATGTLLARGGDQGTASTIKTAPALSASADGLALLYLTPDNVTDLHSLLLASTDGSGLALYQVTGVEVARGQEARIFTPRSVLLAAPGANGTVELSEEAPSGTAGTAVGTTASPSGGRRRLTAAMACKVGGQCVYYDDPIRLVQTARKGTGGSPPRKSSYP